MIHVSGSSANKPTIIGNNVIIEAGAILHGCTVEENTYIGAGSQVLDGAVIQSKAFLTPGSLVAQGKIVPSGQVWSGVPAIYERDLTESEKASFAVKSIENSELALVHAAESDKSWEQIELDEYDWDQTSNRNPEYFQRLTPEVCLIALFYSLVHDCILTFVMQ